MDSVSDLRRHEAVAYFRMVAERGPDADLDGYALHNLGVYDEGDFATLSDVLAGADAGASFAFLGRDADEQAGIVRAIDAAGHDVVLHGHRHVACADLPHSLARENVEQGLAAIEAASGVESTGFFAPLQTMNAETLDVLSTAGIGWAVGRSEVAVPGDLTVVEPEPIVDFELLTDGADPAEAFEALSERAEEGGVFLMHPNVVDAYGGRSEFEAWIDEHRPRPVSTWIEDGGVGLLVDAVRPLKIE